MRLQLSRTAPRELARRERSGAVVERSLRALCRYAPPLAVVLSVACAPAPIAEPPAVDRASFEADVYPILVRDCAFPACHGSEGRFFRVPGPGRVRLDRATGPYAPPTAAEIDLAFDRARSMLVGASRPEDAWLVRKPLEVGAGGAPHMGRDSLGRDVYATQSDPSWRVLAAWAGAMLAPIDGGVVDGGPMDAGALDGGALDAGADASDAAVDAP